MFKGEEGWLVPGLFQNLLSASVFSPDRSVLKQGALSCFLDVPLAFRAYGEPATLLCAFS